MSELKKLRRKNRTNTGVSVFPSWSNTPTTDTGVISKRHRWADSNNYNSSFAIPATTEMLIGGGSKDHIVFFRGTDQIREVHILKNNVYALKRESKDLGYPFPKAFIVKGTTALKEKDPYDLNRKAENFGYPAPKPITLNRSSYFINLLKELFSVNLEFVNPSPDGGVIIEFYESGVYFLIEFFDDGDIVLLRRDEENTKTWDFTSSNQVLIQLKEYLLQ
jgi:hypothetical protein